MCGLKFTGFKTRRTGQPKQVVSGFPCLLLAVSLKRSAGRVQEQRKKPGQSASPKRGVNVGVKQRPWPPWCCVNKSQTPPSCLGHRCFKDCLYKLPAGLQN